MTAKKILNSPAETSRLASVIAEIISELGPGPKSATVVALSGDLGAGKTSFTKSFLKHLGITARVTSPTFIIMRVFDLPSGKAGFTSESNFKKAYHIDAYRVGPKDLIDLGLKDILKDPQNLVVIEWAERIKKILPEEIFWIKIEHGKHIHQRIFKVKH